MDHARADDAATVSEAQGLDTTGGIEVAGTDGDLVGADGAGDLAGFAAVHREGERRRPHVPIGARVADEADAGLRCEEFQQRRAERLLMRRDALEDRGEPAVERPVGLPLVVGVEGVEIGGDAGEAGAQLVVGAAGVQLQRHLVVEEEVVERRRLLQMRALAVEERQVRPVELVGRAEVEIDIPRLHVDGAVRPVGDAIHAGARTGIVNHAHQRRHIGEAAGDVGAMAEADEARALV